MIETIVYKKKGLTVHKCSGSLTEQEFRNAIQSFYKDPSTQNLLWDFSGASMDLISPAFVRQLHSMVRKLGSARRGGKTAIVAPKDLEFAMARMFQIMSDTNDFPFKIKVFRYYGEASQWLLEKK
jgi:hypothetical protein